MLTPIQLDFCRRISQKNLTSKAVVERSAATPDQYGAQAITWSVVDTYPASLSMGDPGDSEKRTETDRVEAHKRFTITLPYNADVLANDRITINVLASDGITINSQVFEVIEPIVDHSYLVSRQFLVKVWQQP